MRAQRSAPRGPNRLPAADAARQLGISPSGIARAGSHESTEQQRAIEEYSEATYERPRVQWDAGLPKGQITQNPKPLTCGFGESNLRQPWQKGVAVSESGFPLPTFENPPVIETLLGVQFVPLKLSVIHLGLFWARIREMYPRYRIQPPLDVAIEEFEAGPKDVKLELRALAEPPVRCWFITEDQAHLIQVQQTDSFAIGGRDRKPTIILITIA